jgi:hypothetical protein
VSAPLTPDEARTIEDITRGLSALAPLSGPARAALTETIERFLGFDGGCSSHETWPEEPCDICGHVKCPTRTACDAERGRRFQHRFTVVAFSGGGWR